MGISIGRMLGSTFATAGLIVATACGSDGGGDGSSASSSGASSSSGQLPGGGDAGVDPQLQGCATDQKKAEPLPLDLYVMFDSSGSMVQQVAPNVSKYAVVVDAMNAFFASPQSAGIGAGLQFFPLAPAGTPATCSSDADCPGTTGPCGRAFCLPNVGLVKWCNTKQDCAAGASCVPAGRCSIDRNAYCANIGGPCDNDPNGFSRGTCEDQTGKYQCQNANSCEAADYAKPAVAIQPLPGAAPALASALAAKVPEGSTPTSAALSGAVDHAKAFAAANTTHTVAVVLVTDGLPSVCDQDMGNISAIAAGALASAKIRTYVVGIFAADQQGTAKTNLDRIAKGGGTGQAFIVSVGSKTQQELLEALNTIRGNALPCEYNVPKPASGIPDYGKVNVQHTTPTGNKALFGYSKTAASCDPQAGGWYYDVDPSGGGTPTKIVLCPASCSAVKSAGGQVDVVLGCQTVVR